MLSLEIDQVVPGHGEVGGKEMVEKYVIFFEELESEVMGFQSQGLSTEAMAARSKMVSFFPTPSGKDGDQSLSWIRRQYQLAAEAVLKERK